MFGLIAVEIKLPKPPEGWEYTGEYRKPKAGESFLIEDKVFTCNTDDEYQFIVRKVKWRAEREHVYWFVSDSCEPEKSYEYYTKSGENRFRNGNYFRTEEEAKKAALKIKQLLKEV